MVEPEQGQMMKRNLRWIDRFAFDITFGPRRPAVVGVRLERYRWRYGVFNRIP